MDHQWPHYHDVLIAHRHMQMEDLARLTPSAINRHKNSLVYLAEYVLCQGKNVKIQMEKMHDLSEQASRYNTLVGQMVYLDSFVHIAEMQWYHLDRSGRCSIIQTLFTASNELWKLIIQIELVLERRTIH